MAPRLGTNPIAWSNDDLRTLGGETPLESCLAEAARAGFQGIELGHKFPRDADRLNPVLAPHGLALISGWYSGSLLEISVDEEWRRLTDHCQLLREMGAEVLIFAETTGAIHGLKDRPLSARPRLDSDELAAWAAKLAALAARLADGGLHLVYHHHMGTVIESEAEIDALMDLSGTQVGLLLDTGHAAFAGIEPMDLLSRHGARIGHIHCKDVRPAVLREARSADLSFLDAVLSGVFTVPGDGAIDFPGLIGELARLRPDYDGWLVVEAEQDPARYNPFEYAKIGYKTLWRAVQAVDWPD